MAIFDSYETEVANEQGKDIRASVPALVSSGNSTSTPLTASGVFTGDWEQVKDFSVVSVLIHSDQPSADQGIEFQWSVDGSTKHDDDVYTYTTEEAGSGKFITLPPETQNFRVVYTNGSSDQSTFELSTVYRTVYIKPSSHRLAEVLTDEADAELVKAVITGKRPDSKYDDVSLTQGGRVRVSNDPPQAPAGTDSVDVVADSTVGGNSSADDFYLVPDGKDLIILSFNGGGAAAQSGDVIELFDDINGDGSNLELIRVAFIAETGGNFAFDLNFSVRGDGSRGIRMRRTRNGGGAARIAAFWSGFEDA